MSTKPTTVPLFDTNLTNLAAVAAGKITDGYGHGAAVPSTDLNYLFNLLGQWAQYVSDGLIDGDLSLGGLFLRSTAKTISGSNHNLDITGSGTLAKVCLAALTTATDTTVTGVLGGTTGRILVLYNKGTDYLELPHNSGASTAGNRWFFPNAKDGRVAPSAYRAFIYDATLAAWVPLFSSQRAVTVDVAAGRAREYTTTHSFSAGLIILANNANAVYYPIPLDQGDRLTSYSLSVAKNTSNTATLTATIVTISATGVEASVAGTTVTESSNAIGTTAMGIEFATPITLTGGLFLRLTPGSSVTPAADRLYTATFAAIKTS